MKLCAPAYRAAALFLAAIFSATAGLAQGLDNPNSLNEPPSLVARFDGYGDSSISDVRLEAPSGTSIIPSPPHGPMLTSFSILPWRADLRLHGRERAGVGVGRCLPGDDGGFARAAASLL